MHGSIFFLTILILTNVKILENDEKSYFLIDLISKRESLSEINVKSVNYWNRKQIKNVHLINSDYIFKIIIRIVIHNKKHAGKR